MSWINKKLYWAWVEDRPKDKDGNLIGPQPPTPTTKKIDYVTIGNRHTKLVDKPHVSDITSSRLAIGVWDDNVYTPLHRDELEFHLNTFVWDDTPEHERPFHGVLVKRP